MKVIQTFSIGAAMMGMTCLFGAIPAANSGQGDLMTDSTQIAQVGGGTSGTGSGTTGGMPSGGGDSAYSFIVTGPSIPPPPSGGRYFHAAGPSLRLHLAFRLSCRLPFH